MLHDDVATVLARTDYHEVVAGFGAEGILVKTMDEVPAALRRARALAKAGRPVLVNVWLDKTEFRDGSISM
jgi:acetolactate synthase-1/2/3 large subunit